MSRVAEQDRAVFLDTCPEKEYEPGETVFRMGDPADSLHLIARGKVKLVRQTMDGHERIISVCGPDDFIGEAFLSDSDAYRVDAVALSPVTTCPMSREQFKLIAERAPGFALTFAELLAGHLHHCRDQLSATYDPVKVRVAKVLMEQAEKFGTPLPDGWQHLDTELKHEDVASLASATRVAVTMAIGELRDGGLIKGSRGRYQLNIPELQDFVEGVEG